MIIESVSLQNFRTYEKQTFVFSPTLTVIIGPNAAGKTNILEAIFLSATGKSFRAEQDSDMVRWGSEVARVLTVINPTNPTNPTNEIQNTNNILLETVLTTGLVNEQKAQVKKYLVNGVARRQMDFVGNFHVVLFSPEDLELVTSSPSLRRAYLNSVLVQVDREYRRNLYSYERGLRQRNSLLVRIHDGEASRNQLLFWDQLLIKTGQYITKARENIISEINKFTLDDLAYSIEYDPSVISESRLSQYTEEEIAAKMTLVGPQRDDFIILRPGLDGPQRPGLVTKDVARFGSRGEQRLAVLWLRLAELEFIEKNTGERPILLLDDILSELDSESRAIVLSVIDKQQTIITSAEFSILEEPGLKKAAIIRL